MPGVHIVLSASANTNSGSVDFNYALLEDYFKLDILEQTPECSCGFSYHEGYPFSVWKDEHITIVLDGIIYNLDEAYVRLHLFEIARQVRDNGDYRNLIRQFVEAADGDFIAMVWCRQEGRLLVFNDCLARLAFYYYCDSKVGVFSRELKTLLKFMPGISLNKFGLAETLMFRYPLGNKTIFRNVLRLEPAQMLEVRFEQKMLNSMVSSSTTFDFILREPFPNKAESIAYLKDAFLAAAECRSKRLIAGGYRLFADLSGGFDTRAVLAGLSRATQSVTYYSSKFAGDDETGTARQVFLKAGSPGQFLAIEIDHPQMDFSDLVQLVYKTEGLVDYHATMVCYQGTRTLRDHVPEVAARFGGLGGEFIRHPAKHYYRSIFDGVRLSLYSMPVEAACQIVRLRPSEYLEQLKEYLNSWPEKTPQDQLKRWYYEYYNHYVSIAAEDRERIHMWTTHPLWGPGFVRPVFNRIPLGWTGYGYFTQFMATMDPRLLKVPIYGNNVRLDSQLSVAVCDVQDRFSNYVRVLKAATPLLRQIYWYQKSRQDSQKMAAQALIETTRQHSRTFDLAQGVFDNTLVEKYLMDRGDERLARIICTELMYLHEVKRRYGDKFEVAS